MLLCTVAHVPSLTYHLLSLRVAADNGHKYTGNRDRETVNFNTGKTLFFSSVGWLYFMYVYHAGALVNEIANTIISPGLWFSN